MQPLIVPVDGSTASWAAVDVAAALARRTAQPIQIVEVVFHRRDIRDTRNRLARTVTELPHDDVVDIDIVVRRVGDTVASEIASLAHAQPGATVVMSSRGRGRSAGVVGSVAGGILQHTLGPILLVGPRTAVEHDFDGPVIVTVDGSEESEAALPLAAAWAIELGGQPWITTVLEPDLEPPPGDSGSESAYPRRLARELTERSGHDVAFETLHGGHPAAAVTDYADRVGAAVIVASSHGRRGISRLAMGSVAAGFVRNATCPVLLVRLPVLQ